MLGRSRIPTLFRSAKPLLKFSKAQFFSAMGSNLLNYWDANSWGGPGSGIVTTLTDEKGGKHLTATGTGSDPLFIDEGGGPNGQDATTFSTTHCYLHNTALSYAAGNRLGIYVVCRLPEGEANTQNACSLRDSSNVFRSASGRLVTSENMFGNARFQTIGIERAEQASVPEAWRLLATRPLSTGALFEIDGVAATTVPFTSSNALEDVGRVWWGYTTLNAPVNGAVAALWLTNEPTETLNEYSKALGRGHFGLSIAN